MLCYNLTMLRIQAGIYKNRKLKKPKNARAIQSKLRQKIFDYLKDFVTNADVLDLFAGAGTFGIEALSHGANSVTFVEKNKSAIKTIQENIELLSLQNNTEIIRSDAITYLNKTSHTKNTRYNIIFIDPPFKMLLHYTPERQKRYIRSLLFRAYKLLKPRSVIILKLHKHLPLSLMSDMAVLDMQKHGINMIYYLVQPQYISKQQKKYLKIHNTNRFFTYNEQKSKFKKHIPVINKITEEQIYKIIDKDLTN